MKHTHRLMAWALALAILIGNFIPAAASETGQLYDYPLTQSDIAEMNATLSSIQSVTNDDSAVIPFLTDLHLGCSADLNSLWKKKPRLNKQLAIYNQLAKQVNFDLCVLGGDYLNNNASTPKVTALTTLRYLGDMIRSLDPSAPIMVARGNHDDNTMFTDYRNGFISNDDFFSAIGDIDILRTQRDADCLDRSYGFYDIPNKKIRVFVLNTVDVPSAVDDETNTINYRGQWDTGFRQEQLQFVADNLHFSEPGWFVLFFSHHPIHNQVQTFPEIGNHTEANGVNPSHGGDSMLEIIAAFQDCLSGTAVCTAKDFESQVEYDFTDNQSNTVIAMINGHSHNFSDTVVNGVHCIGARAVDGHAFYQKQGITSSGIYFVVDRAAHKLHYISCDIADESGNLPTSPDYTFDFEVAEPGSSAQRCTGIRFDHGSLILDPAVSEPVQLAVSVSPEDCTQNVRWESSNEDAVTVDNNGVITVHAMGTAVITAKCGSFAAEIRVAAADLSDPAISGWHVRAGKALNISAEELAIYNQDDRGYGYYWADFKAAIPIRASGTYRISWNDIHEDYPELRYTAFRFMEFCGEKRLTGTGWTGSPELHEYTFTATEATDGLSFNIMVCKEDGTTEALPPYVAWLETHIRIEEIAP